MNVNLSLSPQEEAELEQCASAVGTDVSLFIQSLLRQKLEERNGSSEPAITYEEWEKDFHSWITRQQPRNPHFDDSRESIYP